MQVNLGDSLTGRRSGLLHQAGLLQLAQLVVFFPQPESIFASQQGVFPFFFLNGALGSKGLDGAWLALLVNGYKQQVGPVDQHLLATKVFTEGFDPDLDRRPAGPSHLRLQDKGVVEMDGRQEFQCVDKNRRHIAEGMSPGLDSRGDIDPLHQLAAKQAMGSIDMGHHDDLHMGCSHKDTPGRKISTL